MADSTVTSAWAATSSAVCGDRVESERGDEIRTAEKSGYMELIEEVRPLHDARELIVDIKDRGHAVALVSSAKTKPEPDLVRAGLETLGGGGAVMVGDSSLLDVRTIVDGWDCESARRAGVDTIAVLTGGYSDAELREAGAIAVFESLTELRRRLGETPLA